MRAGVPLACALALAAIGTAAIAAPSGAPRQIRETSTMDNRQLVRRAKGDASSVTQTVSPTSPRNEQAVKTSSPDGSNVASQSVDGDDARQAILLQGRRNTAIQTIAGVGGRQQIIQTGADNRAVQSQGAPTGRPTSASKPGDDRCD